MTFPLGDWQFWVVTASALGSVWVLVRPFLAPRTRKGAGLCSHCGVAAEAPCQAPRGGGASGSAGGSGSGGPGGAAGRERPVVIGDRR